MARVILVTGIETPLVREAVAKFSCEMLDTEECIREIIYAANYSISPMLENLAKKFQSALNKSKPTPAKITWQLLVSKLGAFNAGQLVVVCGYPRNEMDIKQLKTNEQQILGIVTIRTMEQIFEQYARPIICLESLNVPQLLWAFTSLLISPTENECPAS